MPIEHTLADTNIGEVFGTTALPHLRDFTVSGPLAVTGVSDSESRRKIFVCRPTSAQEESACAADIVRKLATQAYRGNLPADDFKDLMSFYERGRKQSDFEGGIRHGRAGDPGEPAFPVPHRADSVDPESRPDLSHQRQRSRVAAVVLSLGIDAGRRAAEGRVDRHAADAGGLRQAGEAAAWPISGPKHCRRALRRSGCGCRTWTRSVPITTSIRTGIRRCPRRWCARRSFSSTA